MKLVTRIIATAAAVAVAAFLLPGITVTGAGVGGQAATLLGVAVIIGLVNSLVKPWVEGFSFCLITLTFGLFLLVINALMLMLSSWIAGQVGLGFRVDGFLSAFLGAIVVGLVSGAVYGVLAPKNADR